MFVVWRQRVDVVCCVHVPTMCAFLLCMALCTFVSVAGSIAILPLVVGAVGVYRRGHGGVYVVKYCGACLYMYASYTGCIY